MSKSKIILAILIAAYTIYFSWATISRHYYGFSGRFDLGNMEQTVWNTSEGRIFQMTNPDTSQISSRLAFHADFLLILIAPIYKLFPRTETLLIVQALVVALGAIPVFLIAKCIFSLRKINKITEFRTDLLALFFSFLYLLSPVIQRANIFEFHSEVLGVTFLLFTFYFLLNEKTKPFLLFFFLSLISKETVSLTLAMICFWGIVNNKKRALCLLLFVGCVTYFLFMVRIAIPTANGVTGRHFALQHYTEGDEKFFDIIASYIKHPVTFFGNLVGVDSRKYYVKLLTYGGFVYLLSPLTFLFSLPTLLINTLAKDKQFLSLNYQYSATVIPGLIISTIYGYRTLQKKLLHHKFSHAALIILISVITLINLRLFSPLPFIGRKPYLDFLTFTYPAAERVRYWSFRIPENASVSVTNNAGAHFAKRKNLYVFSNKVGEADYIIVAARSWQEWVSSEERNDIVSQLKQEQKYKLIDESKDFWLFKKI